MTQTNKLHLIVLIAISGFFLLNSCSDDSSTGSEPDDPPEIPEATPVEIDDSIFTDHNTSGEESEAFIEAGSYAQAANVNITGTASTSSMFLGFTQGTQPVFEDGMWVWETSFSEGGESVTIRNTSEEVPGGVEWNLYISGSWDGEESLNNFNLLSGFVSDDGMSGEWNFYSPEFPGDPYWIYEWETISETEFTFSSTINDPGEDTSFGVDYVRNGDDNSLTYSGYNTIDDILIYWNGSTGEGFIDENGDRRCWDASYQETACG